MNHWELLEIEPTGDSRLIKKAYVAKLKECHPEDDPNGFMQLQEAYKRALRQVEQPAQPSRQPLPAELPDELTQVKRQPTPQAELLDPSNWHSSRSLERQAEVPIKPAIQFMELLEALCADEQQRQDLAAWRNLLNGDIQWPLEIVPLLQNRVMAVLKANTPLPCEVWYGCNELFGWAEPENLADLFTSEELIELFGKRGDAKLSLQVSNALCKQGKDYAVRADMQAALACYENILTWFIVGSDSAQVRHNAAYTAGDLLLMMEQQFGRQAINPAREELWRLLQTADGQVLKLAVTECWLQKVLRLRDSATGSAAAIALCNELIALFDEKEPPAILAKVLYNKGVCCDMLGDDEQTAAVYNKVILLFTGRIEDLARLYLAKSLVNQSCSYAALGRIQQAIAAANQLINAFADSSNEEICICVAMALRNKTVWCERLGLIAQALAACEQAFQIFFNSENEEIQLQIAMILYNQKCIYTKLHKTSEALDAVNLTIHKFAGSKNEKIQMYTAMALTSKSFYCSQLGLMHDMLLACEQALQLFLNSKNEEIQANMAMILYNQGCAYSNLGRNREALAAYDQLLNRFANSTHEEIQAAMAMAMRQRRRVRRKLFWPNMARWIWRSAVQLWNSWFRR